MAIVKMNKVDVIALKSEQDRILDLLMSQGVTQIVDITPESIDDQYGGLLKKNELHDATGEVDMQQKSLREAIDILARYVDAKKVMFALRRTVSKESFEDTALNAPKFLEFAAKVSKTSRHLDEIKAEKNRLGSEAAALHKWEKSPFDVEFAGTKTTDFITGTIPIQVNLSEVLARFSEEAPASVVGEVEFDSDRHYIYVIYHKSEGRRIDELLADYEFSVVNLAGEGRPAVATKRLQEAISACDREYEATRENLREMARSKETLEMLYDALSEKRDKLEARTKLAGTEKAIVLKGWVPAEAAEVVQKSLESQFLCVASVVPPEDGEEYPIELRNAAVIQPFESVTEMYSLPAPNSMDPTAIMAPFFFLFFGMMLSDAGYGLLLALATGFVLWKYKPQGQAKKLFGLIFWGGIATIFWGMIFGSYFGDTYTVVTGNPIPKLMDPSGDPISVLILSFILGLIHLFVGMGAKAYLLIKRGQVWDAIFDIGFWYLVLGGAGVMAAGMVFGDAMMKIGMWTAIAGAAGLILTQGRHKKNIFMRLIGGIGSLYDVTGYLSDILSYSRLLALGLSTGVVASVVNLMGSMGGLSSVGGWILFVIVFLIGHVFNIVINTLGAYVHSSRLQYVEFFGKFYESGGKAFTPLRKRHKYVEVSELQAE